MKLTSLRLHGFKSFADRTEVQFHGGITTIVGPNGCGKSNISDAIRWVLGEQRPTAIRGAKMEEAIFQGSVNRRPVNRGSVTMTVSNADGLLPVPFEEVEIGRTVYRDGGSEYALNRSTCRLRDVHDLCRDTGLGANAYNVIESRMIDAILSDRTEERRSLFEEAAGIGKYKDRRKAAQRRLERAELDLERLEDVIAEVSTKVRSLARQKGKAERYHEFRARRLAVEVSVVRYQLETLQGRLQEIEKALTGDVQTGQGMLAEVAAVEAEYEALRIRQVDAEKARGEAAAALDRVRSKLAEWERDLAVAAERAQSAERRLSQIGSDREETRAILATAGGEAERMGARAAEVEAEAGSVRAEVEAHRAGTEEVQARLRDARERLEGAEGRERDVARRGALLEGDAEAADAQATELEGRLERLQQELTGASTAVTDLASQGDLFSDQLSRLSAAEAELGSGVDGALDALTEARTALHEARQAELSAVDAASSLATRVAALERLEAAQEGVEPAARALLDAGRKGVLGTLADFVSASADDVAVIETYLGPLARGVVVASRSEAEAAREWFRSDWAGGGGLILLPMDAAPEPGGPLPEGVSGKGKGASWVEALLGGVTLVDDDQLLSGSEGTRLSRAGGSVGADGIVRVGDALGTTGVLVRKEELRGLREDEKKARKEAEAATSARVAAQSGVEAAERAVEGARSSHREAEDELRSTRAQEAAQTDQRNRAERHQEDLARQLEGTRGARERSLERARVAREDREVLKGEEEELRQERAAAREALEGVQAEWETARAEDARLSVQLARMEGELERLKERLADVESTRTSAQARLDALDAEEADLSTALDEAGRLRTEGESATETLFRERDEALKAVEERHEALTGILEQVSDAERKAREARSAEREATDRRHRLELERQELDGRIGRIEERLEGEWGRPLEVLLQEAEPLDEDPEVLQEELRELVVKIERLGPVNMLAVEEHAEESARLEFLTEQRSDLVEARDDLRKAIREINQTATTLFDETFQAIRENFKEVHFKLFQGGEADLWLADPEEPLESPIEIHACPRGKKTQRIDLLSGGERALTALSLLFAIYLVKPSPFCVLDEVDGPLDENNIGRFIRLLQEFKDRTQFVVITHNPRTIEAADWIYGVTMEEPGVSTIVGVQLQEALETAGIA
jgi:chromosome segregation protein